jgi:flagellar biosynthesis protein FlhG
MTRDFESSSLRMPLDQADGLRRMFAGGQRMRFIALAANPHVAFSSVLLERVAAACAARGHRVLVVDAADTAPAAHELAQVDLAACIEPLTERVCYLAARGLPLRHVDSRGSMAGLLQALTDAAPDCDVVLVHANAADLGRLFAQRALRPLLLAADHPTSVTHAFAAMKLLVMRNGLMTFDLLLAAPPHSPRRERIAAQLATCADSFLAAVLHDWAAVDPACDPAEPLEPALERIVHAQLEREEEAALPARAWRAGAGWTDASHA